MVVGFGNNQDAGVERAIELISQAKDFRETYAWDNNDNLTSITFSSATHKSVFMRRYAWDKNDNLLHTFYEDKSVPKKETLIDGEIVGNDGFSKLTIPVGQLSDPRSFALRTSINKKYCLSMDDNDYISSVSIETDATESELIAATGSKFVFIFYTLRHITPGSSVNLYMRANGAWETIGSGTVDTTGYVITADLQRL